MPKRTRSTHIRRTAAARAPIHRGAHQRGRDRNGPVVTAASPGQFLGLVPHLVGAMPHESLVLVAFTGRRTHSAIRLNLPLGESPAAIDGFADTAVGMVCKVEGVDGVIPVVYTDREFGIDGVPWGALLRSVQDHAVRAGLAVTDALCVAADGYGSTFDAVVPAGGRPLAEIVETDIGRPLPSRAKPVALPEASAADAAAFARAVASLAGISVESLAAQRAYRRAVGPGRSPDVPPAPQRDVQLAWRAVVEASRFDPSPADDLDEFDDDLDAREEELAFVDSVVESGSVVHLIEPLVSTAAAWQSDLAMELAAALADLPPLRDVVLLTIAWGPEFGDYAFERGVVHADRPLTEEDAMAMAFAGGDMARPSPARVERGIESLLAAAARTDAADRAPLLTLVAWLHWALGRGTTAGGFVDLARGIDPAYGLAELLDRMLGAGMLPEWAYRSTPISEVGQRWQRILEATAERAA